jgi:DnaK suppressor protein
VSGQVLGPARIEALRSALESRRDELEAQLGSGGEAAKPVSLDQQSVGRVSRVDAIQQQQMAIAGRDQAEQQLRQVTLALGRIEDGVYGYCLQCGEPIAQARLEAQPQAGLCLDCQSAAEQG